MAVKVSTWVWEAPTELSGTDLLFLLALADMANPDEGACWPGIKTLMGMCRLETSRAVQKISARLQEKGYIGVILHAGKSTTHGNTNKYFINGYRQSIGLEPIYSGNHPESIDKDRRREMVYNPQGVNGRTPVDGVSVGTPDGVNSESPQGVNGRTPKPSVEPSVEQKIKDSGDKTPEPKKSDADILATCFDVIPQTPKDWKFWGAIVKDLKAAGISADMYPDYIQWIKKQSAAQGNWTVTPTSLTNASRPSLYISEKENKAKAAAAPKNVCYDFTPDYRSEAEILAAQERGES